jgi:hypothetical protein
MTAQSLYMRLVNTGVDRIVCSPSFTWSYCARVTAVPSRAAG